MATDSEHEKVVSRGIHKELAPLCSKENGRAILFYAGAFGIDLFWGLIWQTIEPFVLDRLYGTPDIMTILWMIAPLGSVLFSIVFGISASFQQASKFRRKSGIGMIIGFAICLIIFSLSFSYISAYSSTSQETNNTWAYVLIIIFFSLMIIALSGYTAAFFSISIYFSNELVSRPALPIWGALGQMASTCLVHFIPSSSYGPSKTLILFAIANGFLLVFSILSLVAAYNVFPSELQEASSDSSDTSNICSLLDGTYPISFSVGIIFFAFWLICGSFLVFGLTLFMNGWSKDSIHDFKHVPMIDIPLKANLSRQLVQIFGSILFFYLEYYIVKWQISVRQPTDSSSNVVVDQKAGSRNLQYYANPHSKEFFFSQLTVTSIFFGLSAASSLIFGRIQIENELLAIVGFAITGLGSAVFYSGRELQRSFFRYVRSFEETPHGEALLRLYEYRDNICGSAFFSSFIAIAQVYLTLLLRFGMLDLDYRECFYRAACFAIVALLALLLLFSCPYHPKCDNRSPSEQERLSSVQSKMVRFRRDLPSKVTKTHHH